MPYRSNIRDVTRRMRGIPTRIEAKLTTKLHAVLHAIDDGVHKRTPVWSGRAVRNMIWTKNIPNGTEFAPIGSGDPGPTNSMPLGSEPRRPANETAARATLKAIGLKRPFGIYYLTNVARHIGDLEHGKLPSPERSRSPAGMFGVTIIAVTSKLRSNTL